MRVSFIGIAAASLTLAACTFAASPGADAPEPASSTLSIAGAPELLQPLPDDEPLQWASSVTEVHFLQNQGEGAGVKLFGLASGDPAMNGLYTQIAFYQSPADGWRVFRIGDFLDYRALSDSPGRVDLEIQESTLNQETGEIGTQTRLVIVTWTLGADNAAPDRIAVTPASAS